jgi:propanol-preferring alcohol dehydrogenase
MRAMVLTDYGQPLVLQEQDEGPVERGEVRIRVEAAALCGSDLHAQHGLYDQPAGRFPGVSLPLVLGHQIAGRIVSAGDQARTVVVYCYLYCGTCRRCLEGRQNLCERTPERIGFEVPGGFADYVTVPERNVFPAPAGLTAAQASVLPDAVTTSFHAVVRRGRVAPGERVAVFGVGALGLYAIRFASLAGGRVVAVDRSTDERLRWAQRFGAAEALAAPNGIEPDGDVPERLVDALGGPPDVVFDFVALPQTLDAATEVVRPDGRIVVVGVGGRGRLRLRRCAEKRITVCTSLASTPADLIDVLALAERGMVEPIVADSVALEDVNEALQRLAAGRVIGRLVAVP